MGGLREKHRADRHRRILEAAAGLFRQSGYDGARIDQIATEAGVSVGTIYNYYRNKGDILVAIVSMEVNDVLAAGERIVRDPPLSVEAAVDALIATYIRHSLVYLDKPMWRQAMAISTQQPDSPFGQTYSALDRALADQTCALVARLQSLELANPQADTRSVGEMLFNNTNMMFIDFVKQDAATIADLLAAIARQNRVLAAAIAI